MNAIPADSRPLRRALLANAAFSLATGLALAAAPGACGEWLGFDADGLLQVFGGALLAHAAVLVALSAALPRGAWLARVNAWILVAYPPLCLALILLLPMRWPRGAATIAGDGLVVAGLAALQLLALREGPGAKDSASRGN